MNEAAKDKLRGRYLGFLQSLIPELIERSAGLKFDSADKGDLYSIMLYASIVELANGACRLIAAGEPTGVGTVTRMALEALVDLRNLASDPEYINYLELRSLKEWQQTYELAESGNSYVAAIVDEPTFQEQKQATAQQIQALHKQGFRQLSAEARFERAGMEENYGGMYRWLCSDTHNSLRGLMLRHVRVSGDGSAEICILREPEPGDNLKEIDALCGFLISASQLAHQCFGNGAKVIDDLEGERVNLQKQLQ